MQSPAGIREVAGVDRQRFESELIAAGEPVVLRNLAAHWPIVAAARASDAALGEYLLRLHNAVPVTVMSGPPAIDGRLFYKEGFRSLNFQSVERPFAEAMRDILATAAQATPPTLYIGCAASARHWPTLAAENPQALLGPEVIPNLWIGGRAVVGAHNDSPENIACVVAGRRRFRVFPPEQFANLYVGPLEFNPAGRPVSFVSVTAPDLTRYPRYRDALAASREAVLEPGDAIYIPSLWWHSVESLAPLNALLNYWWELPGVNPRHMEAALLQALMAFSTLAPRQRRAWQAVFDHLVFQADGDPVAHIPPEIRGWLGALTPDLRDRMKSVIRRALID
jgi:hypothetical protein